MSEDWTWKDRNLRNVLAGLFYRDPDIERIVLDAQLEAAYIAWDERPINTWGSIVRHAKSRNKVQDVIAEARKAKPDSQALARAEQDLLLNVKAPTITDSAWQGPKDKAQLEKYIRHGSTLRPFSFLEQGVKIGRSVARIQLHNESTGSGFLVKDNILITNHHVIPSPQVAAQAKVQFNYQQTLQGTDATPDPYDLAPEEGFLTSPKEEQGGDDWTAVKVKGNPKAKWGTLSLIPANPKAGDEVIIIQHPMGARKLVAMTHNTVAYADDRRVQYLTETEEGSSGSPVFDIKWRLVAVHYTGGWMREPGTEASVYRNAGIHINLVIEGIKDLF